MTPEEYGKMLREQLKGNQAFQDFSEQLHQDYTAAALLLGRFVTAYRNNPESEETLALQKQIEQAGGTIAFIPGADPDVHLPL